jgi:hypothetical protein
VSELIYPVVCFTKYIYLSPSCVPWNVDESLGMKPSTLECSRVSWNADECLGMHPSAAKTTIVIRPNAYRNIVFVNVIFA